MNLVQLKPANINNISIDSLYISKVNTSNLEITVLFKNQGEAINNVPVSLFNNDVLLAKSSIDIENSANTVFTIPLNEEINGKITINDRQLQFDNTLFFNFNKPEKIRVLSINDSDDQFLNKVYRGSEFSYKSVAPNKLNYNDIDNQNLIILNELKSVPSSLITALNVYKTYGGNLLIIPSEQSVLSSYNQLFKVFNLGDIASLETNEKRITNINFSHPLFKDVFSKKISNFQYPKVNSYFKFNNQNLFKILNFEDGNPFLANRNNIYVFSSSLNNTNSNFKNSPLIVPTLYNIGKQSLLLSKPYYKIGVENKIDILTSLKQDEILTLVKNDARVIPQQQTFKNKVLLTTNDTPEIAGIYKVSKNDESIQNISYNYDRAESELRYANLVDYPNTTISNSIKEVINNIKSSTKVNELWKWFVIFALVLLIFEMLILKFFK